MKKTLLHYTLNTGDTRVSPREEVSDEAIAALQAMLEPGNRRLPDAFSGYYCAVRTAGEAMMATILDIPGRPCVGMGVAPNDAAADSLWPELERHYLAIGDTPGIRSADFSAPRRPESTPWCGAITILATPDEAYWMADFERCLAWAWIDALASDWRPAP